MKKIPNSLKAYLAMFWLGILAGVACRLSDIFPYDSLWSLSSIASLFGFWIASAGAITWLSSSNGGAAAVIAKAVKTCEVITYEDLGAEAIHKLEVEDLVCFVAIDAQGGNLYETGRLPYAKD